MTKLLQLYFAVDSCQSASEAENMLLLHDYCVLLCDDRMPGETGLDFMGRIHSRHPHLQRILLSGAADKERLSLAINHAKVDHFLNKTVPLDEMAQVCLRAAQASLSRRRAAAEAHERQIASLTLTRWERWQTESQRAVRVMTQSLPVLLAGVLIIGTVVALMGALVLMFLYFLKTALGIDFIEHRHLGDWFR
jgi:DNA-binding NtrC family response regulator